MKNIFLIALGFSLCCPGAFSATDDAKKAEMMKAWKEASTPGTEHEVLKQLVGNWKYTSKFWETKDSKPQESAGQSGFKMILGGRFLQHETKGKAMNMPFQGLGILGYDKVKGKYTSLWLDSMSTAVMKGEGSFDTATKTLKDSGEYSCPIAKEPREYRSEWKIIDKNNHVFSMYGPGLEDDDEYKHMELVFKRK